MKTWKIVVLALLFCLVSLTAFSLDAAVGLKGGIGLAHLSGPGYQDTLDFWGVQTQPKLGYCAGVFATLGLTDLAAFQAEAYYAVLGGKYGDDTGSLVEDYPVFQIPLLLKLRLNSGGFTVTPLAGPVVLIKAGDWEIKSVDADGNEAPLGTRADEDVADLIFGAVAGIGLEMNFDGYLFSLEARYMLGLTPLFKEGAFTFYEMRQNNLEVLVGVALPLM